MSEILLVNPRKRRRRKMSALQRKYFGGGRRKRRAKATSHRRRRRRSHAVTVHKNPRRRRALGYVVGKRRIRRRRLNPSFRSVGSSVMPLLKDGFVGATGAIGLDFLWSYGKQYLPASIAGSAIAQYGVKLLGAIAVGIVGNKVLRGRGRALSVGAATVVLHDAMKAQIQASFPSVQLGEYLTYAPAVGTMRRAGRVLSTGMNGMGEYLSGIPSREIDGNYSGDYTTDNMNGCADGYSGY